MIKRHVKNKKYTEGEIVDAFSLTRLNAKSVLLNDWLDSTTTFDDLDYRLLQRILEKAKNSIHTWNEEELKMNFLSYILGLIDFDEKQGIRTFYERSIEALVNGVLLKTKTDFMVATGVLDFMKKPYFHFQEYKKDKDPNGDPLGQLLEAFLIAQVINNNQKPLYGAYVIGRFWYFVIMDNNTYCVSSAFDSTKETDLIHLIAILRRFKEIIEAVLM